MLSLVVGSNACMAKCPFCVSGETPCKENMTVEDIGFVASMKLKKAIMLAENSGVDTVMLTSRGETLLYPEDITYYMGMLRGKRFPFIELQTNGLILAKKWEEYEEKLHSWFAQGLSTITISNVSYSPKINSTVYTNNDKKYMDLPGLIEKLHKIGFTVRLTCVMCNDWMDTSKKVQGYLTFAKNNSVEQVTMRPLNDEYRRKSAQDWITEHKIPEDKLMEIWNWMNENGTALLEIPRVGTVFDVNGQNVMFSKPLTKYTRDLSPDNGRNLIFFREGRVAYEWEMEGGTLL